MQPKKLLTQLFAIAVIVFNPQYGIAFLLFLLLIKFFKK